MRLPRNLPIQRKVTLVVLVTCIACLLVACGALFLFEWVTFRSNFVNDLTALTEVVANSTVPSVAFDDKDAAVEILDGLKARPHIVGATIMKRDAVFASFGRADDPASIAQLGSQAGYRFEGNSLIHVQPIMMDGEPIGTLYVRSDYGSVARSLLRLFGAILGLVLLVSVTLAVVISSRLQRFVSEPILRLAHTARSIAENKDYSVRADGNSSNDEVGLFTDAFNQMLTQIEAQDSQLHGAQQNLENQVTALQREIGERQRAEHQLADAHRQLVETSRQAGMAEVATGVLHNVGNVLNSVNVSANLVSDRVSKSRVSHLSHVSTALSENAADLGRFITSDPKGRKLPSFIASLAERLGSEQTELLHEAE